MSSYVRQSIRIRPPFGEVGDPPLPPDGTVLYEEDFWLVPNQIQHPQQMQQESNIQQINPTSNVQQMNQTFVSYDQEMNTDESFIPTDNESLLKKPSKNELAHADYLERLIVVSSNKKRQRPPSTTSTDSLYHQDENNDLVVEKLLKKFENISKDKSNHYTKSSSNNIDDDDDDVIYGPERIIERRYYVKKSKSGSKRNQVTSTTDLTGGNGKKNRQLSGVSSITAVTSSSCSQCTSTTPTYVESLRNQSSTLQNEINGLKNEITQLQTSQQQFLQQIQTQFQPKIGLTTTSQSFNRPTASPTQSQTDKTKVLGNMTISVTTGQRSRSISTESIASSSLPSTRKSTPTQQTNGKPAILPLTKPNASLPQISEFLAHKSPSVTPTPIVNAYIGTKSPSLTSASPITEDISSKPSSKAPTPLVNNRISSKHSSVASTPTNAKPSLTTSTPFINTQNNSKPSSVAPTPPVNTYMNLKPPSIASTPPINTHKNSKPSSIVSEKSTIESSATKKPLMESTNDTTRIINSRTSSTTATPQISQSPKSSAHVPIYENELAHRRVLSPHSQIVASSLSAKDSSDESSRSTSPESIKTTIPQKLPKIPESELRDNDLKDLVQYSSQLEVSGFPPSKTAVINNPNTNSIFWDSVDHFIQTTQSTKNVVAGKPPIPPSNTANRFGLYNNTSKQLDKYDLEIKPQEIITSSAPLLMPPFDNLP